MNICTIATVDWLDAHVARWLRKIRENVPGAKTHLLYVFGGIESLACTVIQSFDVAETSVCVADYKYFDTARMGLTKLFGVNETLYIDADADVLADISDIPALSDKPLLCCRSPVMNRDWFTVAQRLGYGIRDSMWNNGLLYMRQDFSEPYRAAWAKTEAVVDDGLRENGSDIDKTMGLCAFNVMLIDHPDVFFELPQEYGEIWIMPERASSAKVIQYCNNRGHAKHERLEALWRAMHCTQPATS